MNFKMNLDTPATKLGYAVIPTDKRGIITGNLPPLKPRIGGDKTNKEYAKEHGISTRQASKKRRM